ncbi:MAG: phosphatidylglycerophosphatase A [Desulfuromonadales bacterium]|nr:phosphatidylglycerophosphatase A [Desulfuromonadales bacterium]
MRRFILFLSSNAGLGYAPVASGTFGTLAGIPAYWLLAKLPPTLWLLTVLALFFLSCWVAGAAGKIYGVVDDGRIVIDELIGYLVTIALLPFTWKAAILGFFLFRVFDILKPQPARYFDRQIKNGYGVVLDDVVAGLYAALCLRLFLHFYP